jgi:uncharacterized protein with HEPN domain
MKKSARPHLILIEQALDQIDSYRPASEREFLDQQIAQDAILMRLQQIGENLIKIRDLAPEAFERVPESWNKLIGLRNVISHAYDTIEVEIIWEIISQELTPFRSTIKTAIAQLPEP